MLAFKVTKLYMEYGCPKEFKGAWDQMLGVFTGVFEEACVHTPFTEIADVVRLWQSWGDRQFKDNPDGPRFRFAEFMPPEKSTCQHSRFTPASLMGVQNSFSWSFTCNDRRAIEKGSFALKRDPTSLEYLTVRNHVMSGLKATAERTGRATLSLENEPVEVGYDDEPPLLVSTRLYRGWRISFKRAEDNLVRRRRRVLAGH